MKLDVNLGELVDYISNVIIAMAAVATAILARRGLRTWQEELRGKAGYDAAYQYLFAALKLRREIQAIRSPVQFLTEEDWAHFTERGIRGEDYLSHIPAVRMPAVKAWYHFRWQPVRQAMQELEAAALDAQTVIGDDAVQEMRTFRRLMAELHTAIRRYLNSITETDPESRKTINREVDPVIYSSEDDDFSNRLNGAIRLIREKLQQHLG